MVFLSLTMGETRVEDFWVLHEGFCFSWTFLYLQLPLPVSETSSVFLLNLCSSFVGVRAPGHGGKTWCPKERPGMVLCRMSYPPGSVVAFQRLPWKRKGLK